jgi:hypothetical protein
VTGDAKSLMKIFSCARELHTWFTVLIIFNLRKETVVTVRGVDEVDRKFFSLYLVKNEPVDLWTRDG